MKRGKKLFRNICIIVLVLLVRYYFGGYYISKEQCVEETLRGLYATETEVIMDLGNGDEIKTLVADLDNRTVSIIGTRKTGFLYHTASSSIGEKMKADHKIYVTQFYDSRAGMVNFIYRNDKTIDRIVVELDNGMTFVLDEWNQDFTGFFYDSTEWVNGTYRSYNESGQLIEEMEGQ